MVLLDAPERFSFAYGLLTPRVVVSCGLLEGVSDDELRAILEHEHYHVCNLDPLKVVLVQALSATFFFLPALDSLRARYLAGRELEADRRAVNACGRRPLVSALLKVVRGPDWSELEGVAAIGGHELLDVRVAQLETGIQPKARNIQHHSHHDLASRRGPVRCHVPRISIELRRPSRGPPGDWHRANDRRSDEWSDLRRPVRVRGIGRLLAYRQACQTASHHESVALMSGLLMVCVPRGWPARPRGAHLTRVSSTRSHNVS